MPSSQPAFRAEPVDHPHSANETCPYCEQPIPNERAAEIRHRFALKEQRNEAAMRARVEQQVADARRQIETEKNVEIDRVKAEALAQQTAAREEGKKAAEAEAQQKMQQLASAQQAGKLKLEESERQRLTAVNQYETLKTQTDTVVATRIAEVRAALEKGNAEVINAKDAQHSEAMQNLSDQLRAMQRRVDAVEGEGADVKLFDILRQNFPKDDIKVISKPTGADILHLVKHNKKDCGVIVYDSRNRNAWKSDFASKLREDMVAAKALHAILTASKFPGNKRQVCICDGVIVANPARVLVLVEILREEIVRTSAQRIGEQDRERKTVKLYDFITSERFDNVLESLTANDDKLLALDEEEQKIHKKTWEKRRLLATNAQKLHGNLRNTIDRIIGTAEAE